MPIVTAELRVRGFRTTKAPVDADPIAAQEAEQKRRLDEAVVHRKRSTRIALKELGKEEERQARKKREVEEEKMSRARRLEVRQKKEEDERLRRENAREKRRKEREQREEQMAEEEVQLRFFFTFFCTCRSCRSSLFQDGNCARGNQPVFYARHKNWLQFDTFKCRFCQRRCQWIPYSCGELGTGL